MITYNISYVSGPLDLSIDNLTFNGSYSAENLEKDTLQARLNLVILPLIALIGIFGNILSFYILLQPNMRHQSCNVYLAFLALVDCGFILCLAEVWIDYLNFETISHGSGACQILPFLTYVLGFLSVYTVVCFTVERFIITFYPLQRIKICTTRRAKIVLLVFTVCALIFYSFPLYMSVVEEENGQKQCLLREEYTLAAHILSYTDTVLTLVLPALIIITLNIAISIKLASIFSEQNSEHLGRRRSTGQVHSLTVQSRNGSACSEMNLPMNLLDSRPRGSIPTVRLSSSRTTLSLLIISTVFVLLNLPSHALRVYALLSSFNHSFLVSGLGLWQEIAQFIYYLNFASNFFLYSLCSRTFRETLKAVILYKILGRPQPMYHQVLHLGSR